MLEPSIIQFLELGLANEGAIIQTATNGQEALQKLEMFKPHVMILDVMMPELDGFETCQRAKAPGNEVAIIMLTAKDDIQDRVKRSCYPCIAH